MKNKIIELLKQDDKKLYIKQNIYLNRYTKNALGDKCDMLKLDISVDYARYNTVITIETRDINEIIDIIVTSVEEFYKNYGEGLAKEIKNGYL